MLEATSQLLSRSMPLAAKFARQIFPPVIATLIAALVIAGVNRTFSGHLQQPRMAALHAEEAPPVPAASQIGMTKPPTPSVTETITIYEEAVAPERLAEKDSGQEAGKDQTVRLATTEPAPQPVRAAAQPARPEPKAEVRPEHRRVATVELPPPAMHAAPAPAPVTPVIVAVPPSVVAPPAVAPNVAAMPPTQERVPQPHYQQAYPQQQPYQQYPQPQYQPPYAGPVVQPPPVVVMAPPPVVTVPDRPRPPVRVEEADARRPNGEFVNVFKPSTWFARAREFGEKIEQAGNDILPNIRQQ